MDECFAWFRINLIAASLFRNGVQLDQLAVAQKPTPETKAEESRVISDPD